jgi:hypothetical protein
MDVPKRARKHEITEDAALTKFLLLLRLHELVCEDSDQGTYANPSWARVLHGACMRANICLRK